MRKTARGKSKGNKGRFVGMPDDAYFEKLVDRFEANVDRTGDCHQWTGPRGSSGRKYGLLGVGGRCFADGRYRRISAHRLAVYLATGVWHPSTSHVMHKCDNMRCVRAGHLEIGTNVANILDARAKRRGVWMRASLTPADVRVIRRLFAEGVTQRAIAERFGVAKGTVWPIVHGLTWAWVTDIAA
jgi:hypothetical protein